VKDKVNVKNFGHEGYIYHVYGDVKYLQHAVSSAQTIRRYDQTRKIALVCEEVHRKELRKYNLEHLFDVISEIEPEHRSITGFKHNVHRYQIFERSLFLDSDIIWCRNPDHLWENLRTYDFTITGNLKADAFFGAPKGFGVLKNIVLKRRERTLKRFGLRYLIRVQSGMMFIQDDEIAKKVCELASEFISRMDDTHFQSRGREKGRNLESCEWSLAMAMSALDIPVLPWLQGHTSPQLDYIEDQCEHDDLFLNVTCKFHTNNFIYSLRGLKHEGTRKALINTLSFIPGFSDYMTVKPYCLHFGWLHQKNPFYQFSDRIWSSLISGTDNRVLQNTSRSEFTADQLYRSL
jgi:hypothetical protein